MSKLIGIEESLFGSSPEIPLTSMLNATIISSFKPKFLKHYPQNVLIATRK